MTTFLLPITEGAFRRTIEEATEELLLEIPIQPISPHAASLILSSMAQDTPLVTSVWPYTDFPVWDMTSLKADSFLNITEQNDTSQTNKSSGFTTTSSSTWEHNRLRNASVSRDSALRVGGQMRNGAKVRVEINTHLEQRPTYDVFGIVRGAVEPGVIFYH